jgi:acetylornithine deacetylase/succinyl-diaminopimelate desuccinylase-like protein
MTPVERARRFRSTHAARLVRDFAGLLAIPDVAADPGGLRRTAGWIADRFNALGADAEVLGLDGAPPVVVGRIEGSGGGPTIGVYAHYDGQPVDPAAWSVPPFGPTLLTGRLEDGGEEIDLPADGTPVHPDWRIYARGSADDRAPIMALSAALEALQGSTPDATVVFLFEGEEEVGSPHLPDYLDAVADRLAADVWLICDGPVHQTGRPQVVFGVRGFAEVEIEVFGPPHDLHSGHYGEWAVNPAAALSDLLASMRDIDGAVAIEGFDQGAAPTDAEVDAARAVPDPGDLGFVPNDAHAYAEGLLTPLLNVRGIRSGDVGDASRNAVPATALASIDLRLVAGQDPVEAIQSVRRHAAARGFHLVDGKPSAAERSAHRLLARIDGVPGYPGVRTSPDHPAFEPVIEAVRAAAGDDPVIVPSFGGSVPLHHFEALGAPLAILPIANHDNNQHSPDENLRVGNLWYGVDVMAALLGG